MTNDQLLAEVDSFMSSWQTLSLATVDEAGQPHAANLQYVHDAELRLVFVSNPDSAHARHIARDRRVAATIYGHVDSPGEIHGVQLHGQCEAITDDEARQIFLDLFASKYPFVDLDANIRARVDNETLYLLTPSWVRWIDNRREFGWKSELVL